MSSDPSALLIVDIGTLFTHVALIDQVAGEYRAVARTQALSTLEAPESNAWVGIRAAIRLIEQITARRLTTDDAPMMPQQANGNGIDAVLFTSSAAGTLPVVIAAISEETSGDSLRRVAQATYTLILDSITFDEQREKVLAEGESWIDHQLSSLVRLPGATVLMAGGVEGGNVIPLERLAHMLGFTVLRPEQQTDHEYAHVLFAGNSAALDVVHEALSTIVPITPAPNIRPTLEQEQLLPARNELIRLYSEKVLPKLAGYNRLRSISNTPIRTTSECFMPITRFLSVHTQRHVLCIDIGALNTACYAAYNDRLATALLTNNGTAYGCSGVLDRAGNEHVLRWLPFDLSNQALHEQILNRLLRPQIVPITQEDLFLNQALAREALRPVLHELQQEWPTFEFDLIVATGGVLTHVAHPAEALLMLLDVLPIAKEATTLVLDIYLDRDGLLPMCGALAWVNADAAFCVLEQDALRNGPLASCVVVHSTGTPGTLAVEVELTPVSGPAVTIPVMHGEIRRIPLPPGRRGTLHLRPAPQVRIGTNRPGEDVQSDVAAIQGSTLGIVIDARGRPLQPGTVAAERQQQIWGWLAQLGAVPSVNPYAAAAVQSLSGYTIEAAPAEPAAEAMPEEPAEIPAWLQEDLKEQGLIQPPPEEFGIVEMPEWLQEDADMLETPDGVLDLEERSQPTNPNDFGGLRTELQEDDKTKRRWFRRK